MVNWRKIPLKNVKKITLNIKKAKQKNAKNAKSKISCYGSYAIDTNSEARNSMTTKFWEKYANSSISGPYLLYSRNTIVLMFYDLEEINFGNR